MTAGARGGITVSAEFLGVSSRRIFILERGSPILQQSESLIVVPPFAEEMNRSRRMFTLLAQRLAVAGIVTTVVDLAGTGDSDGEFGDATWEAWLDDLDAVTARALAGGCRRLWLCGLRLGALLALDFLARRAPALNTRLLLWQPIIEGSAALTQFLRLRLAGGMRAGAPPKETTRELRERLRAGESLEVAGYMLNPALGAAIERLRLEQLAQQAGRKLVWLEIRGSGAVSPSSPVVQKLKACGLEVEFEGVDGEPFWSLQETTVAPALIDATLDHIRDQPVTRTPDERSTAHN